jgi:16S rRNA (cytosine1402-N4)-methyltransferase
MREGRGVMVEHISVLLEESLQYLNIKPNGIYVDCTLGGGGHSLAILNQLTTGHLYAFDQDDYAIQRATEKLQNHNDKFTIIRSNFEHLQEELTMRGIHHVDGILYDLGVSSFHFDLPERGFSYQLDAPLDMRMDTTQELTAKRIVNEYSYHDLVKILYRYGEESFAKQIARTIEHARKENPINTTFELVDIIKQSLPQKVLKKKGHPAKKTFQALRIAVNDELGVFERSLSQAFDLLAVNGRIVVISFHSLEDRIAKLMFREKVTVDIPKHIPITPDLEPNFKLLHRKVITASDSELAINNRSHSAKLRAIERVKK